MKTFKVVGWYATDPHDETTQPYSLVVWVQAENKHMAFDTGHTALDKTAPEPKELLNWYVKEESK